ncbi:MAG: AraC family transcriptional regulator [Sporocytophaga sp.]|uniref:AraC family transcriptional regulator n=1 Tax=Sporocytophaga sp. TaxID=2231183 RepID=UPI001B17AD20|nr:helix-turn-helix transcriptional regulator [Sporocytophaga sp.]MBO9701136.1 AraC family transcriptional regulator [Sporocytophaga sp.]
MKQIPIRRLSSKYTELSVTGQFSIRKITDILKGRDIVHDLHRHDFFLILLLEKGEGTHEIDFIKHQLHNHDIFILRPGQVHALSIKSKSTGYIMEFDPAFYQPTNKPADQRFRKAIGKNYCKVKKNNFNKLESILSSIFNEFNKKQEDYIDAIKVYLELFFIEYLRQSVNEKRGSKIENLYIQDRFEELMSLLEENICSKKNASQYAELLNLSLYQLNSITKSSVGKSISDLINQQIILEAKRFLLGTTNQIKDIADHIGYDDVSYFIRFFRKQTGYTPDAFRQNFK